VVQQSHDWGNEFDDEFVRDIYVAMKTWILTGGGVLLLVVGALAGAVSAPRYELLLAISLAAELGAMALLIVVATRLSGAARLLPVVGVLLASMVIADAVGRILSGFGWL
jgi:hypothetical protein